MDQRVNSLYFSPTGTTAQVVKAIAGGMDQEIKEYNITLAKDREKGLDFGEDDLVIVGVPVYGGRIPYFLEDYFAKVKGGHTPVVLVAVYGNRDYDDALLELKNIFESNGFLVAAAGAFIGEHSFTYTVATGRPDGEDLDIAARFGRKIKEKLTVVSANDWPGLPAIKGNYPYKERKAAPPMAPETGDQCIACGTCAKCCPTGAIDWSDFAKADAKKCIRCCSCIKKCPVGAKAMQHEAFINTRQFLIENCQSIRRQPELYV